MILRYLGNFLYARYFYDINCKNDAGKYNLTVPKNM